MKQARTLRELFSFDGFTPKPELEGKFGDSKVRIIELIRKKKRQAVPDAQLFIAVFMIEKFAWHVTAMQKVIESIFVLKNEECIVNDAIESAWKL